MHSSKTLWLAPLILLAACGNADHSKSQGYSADESAQTPVAADSVAPAVVSTQLNGPGRKVVHTADFQCKVNDVFTAVTAVENLVKSTGGIVQDSRIENTGYDSRTIYYKPDSLKRAHIYTPTATLTLRVPAAAFDSVVNAIPRFASFIDSRALSQSDVTYKLLSNELKDENGHQQNAATKAMALARKSKEPIEIQRYEDERRNAQIARKLENLSLMDDVNYTTFTVQFSQPEQVYVQIVANPDYFTSIPFGLKCKAALLGGWHAVNEAVVALIYMWPLVIAGIALFVLVRRVRRRRIAVTA